MAFFIEVYMKIDEYEVFKFGENKYTPFSNNGKEYLINKEPYLDIVLTDYCNANCNFCIADLIHNKLNGDLELFKKKVMFAVENMNVKEVLLLGGEPTMSKMLIPMAEWLTTVGLDKIVMTTNGIRLAQNADYANKVLSSGITHLNVSFMNHVGRLQKEVTNATHVLSVEDVAGIYSIAKKNNVSLRVNNNVFKGNNDSLESMLLFYSLVKPYCDSIKFSPLLEVDNFSVVDRKTKWAKDNRLNDDAVYALLTGS